MKILEIDYYYYCFPNGIDCLDDFIAYANEHYNSFIKLTKLETENCTFPYFISEDTKEVYLNTASISRVSEEDVTVLCRADYEIRLEKAIKKKCIDCAYYEEDSADNLKGHHEKLSLDGECLGYEKKSGSA